MVAKESSVSAVRTRVRVQSSFLVGLSNRYITEISEGFLMQTVTVSILERNIQQLLQYITELNIYIGTDAQFIDLQFIEYALDTVERVRFIIKNTKGKQNSNGRFI